MRWPGVPVWWQGLAPVWRWICCCLDFLIYWWHPRPIINGPSSGASISSITLDRTLDSTSALRFHFGEVLISAAARSRPRSCCWAFPLLSIVAFETLLLIANHLSITRNLRLPAPAGSGAGRSRHHAPRSIGFIITAAGSIRISNYGNRLQLLGPFVSEAGAAQGARRRWRSGWKGRRSWALPRPAAAAGQKG